MSFAVTVEAWSSWGADKIAQLIKDLSTHLFGGSWITVLNRTGLCYQNPGKTPCPQYNLEGRLSTKMPNIQKLMSCCSCFEHIGLN
jgi:hypothetical protein